MLNNIIEEEDDCFVFFYDDVDPDAHAILSELEGMYTVMFTYKIQTLMMQQQSIYIHNTLQEIQSYNFQLYNFFPLSRH